MLGNYQEMTRMSVNVIVNFYLHNKDKVYDLMVLTYTKTVFLQSETILEGAMRWSIVDDNCVCIDFADQIVHKLNAFLEWTSHHRNGGSRGG